MSNQQTLKNTSVIIVMAAACLMMGSIVYPIFHAPQEVEAVNQQLYAGTSSVGIENLQGIEPQKLTIPHIGVDADVETKGISTENTIMIPSHYEDVAWFKYSAKPGEKGTAIMVGHLDVAGGFPGVFIRLDELKPGDDIYVSGPKFPDNETPNEEKNTDSSGTTGTTSNKQFHFKVTGTTTVDYNDIATVQKALQNTTSPHIMLITCFGTWLSENKTYNERFVVMGDVVND